MAEHQSSPKYRTVKDLISTEVLELPKPICAVYFLLRGEEVVYVGQSIDLPTRLWSHMDETTAPKAFDGYAYIECEAWELSRLEQKWIDYFDPVENTRQTTRQALGYKQDNYTPGCQHLRRLRFYRYDFGTPTILDLAIPHEDKKSLARKGIHTIRKLRRNKELASKYSEALSRFDYFCDGKDPEIVRYLPNRNARQTDD